MSLKGQSVADAACPLERNERGGNLPVLFERAKVIRRDTARPARRVACKREGCGLVCRVRLSAGFSWMGCLRPRSKRTENHPHSQPHQQQ